MTMNLFQTTTLTTSAASIEFTNIPQTATDLMILVSSRADNFNGKITFNGSTSAQYSYRELLGDGSGRTGSAGTDDSFLQVTTLHEPKDFNGTNNTTDIASNSRIYIFNYTGSQNKSINIEPVMEFNGSSSYHSLYAGRWSNSAAITSMKIETTSGNLLALSTISLYTITNA